MQSAQSFGEIDFASKYTSVTVIYGYDHYTTVINVNKIYMRRVRTPNTGT